jgi:3-deoxy-manno-octulosonate cytidylyltransferase (CMP-KDO synthetase)
VSAVIVATDDQRIQQAVETFGGEAVMTSASHSSGTERIAEVAQRMEAKIYVNVQGDEPLLAPEAISAAVQCLLRDDSVQVATLCVPISQTDALSNPNVVKVVCDSRGDALYFSRSPIPFTRATAEMVSPCAPVHLKHIGLYAFRRAALLEFPKLPRGPLEQSEQLEQLRLLENGLRIRVIESAYDSISVDVPEDLARVEQILRGR